MTPNWERRVWRVPPCPHPGPAVVFATGQDDIVCARRVQRHPAPYTMDARRVAILVTPVKNNNNIIRAKITGIEKRHVVQDARFARSNPVFRVRLWETFYSTTIHWKRPWTFYRLPQLDKHTHCRRVGGLTIGLRTEREWEGHAPCEPGRTLLVFASVNDFLKTPKANLLHVKATPIFWCRRRLFGDYHMDSFRIDRTV